MIIKNGTFDEPFSRDYIARVGLFADVHIGYDSWGDYSSLKNLISNMNAKNPDFCFILGDCVDSGYADTPELMAQQVGILDECFSQLESPLFKLKGNHDNAVDAFTEFGVVTFNGLRFVCIFPKYIGVEPPEGATVASRGQLTETDIEWIGNALADGAGYRHVVLSHYAVANSTGFGWPISDIVTDIYTGKEVDGHRDDLVALLTSHNVEMFLNGHEHAAGLVNAKVDATNTTNVQIRSTMGGYVVLTIYEDRYEFIEYNLNNEVAASLTVTV